MLGETKLTVNLTQDLVQFFTSILRILLAMAQVTVYEGKTGFIQLKL
jgi:hypothetical protein